MLAVARLEGTTIWYVCSATATCASHLQGDLSTSRPGKCVIDSPGHSRKWTWSRFRPESLQEEAGGCPSERVDQAAQRKTGRTHGDENKSSARSRFSTAACTKMSDVMSIVHRLGIPGRQYFRSDFYFNLVTSQTHASTTPASSKTVNHVRFATTPFFKLTPSSFILYVLVS